MSNNFLKADQSPSKFLELDYWPSPIVRLDGDGKKKLGAFMDELDSRSLVSLELKRLLRSGALNLADRFLECDYRVRPWITNKLKRTEVAEGWIQISGKSGTKKVEFPLP